MTAEVDFELVERFEETPEYKAVLNQIRELEASVKDRVDEAAWDLIIKWEELWAQLLVEQQRLFLKASDKPRCIS